MLCSGANLLEQLIAELCTQLQIHETDPIGKEGGTPGELSYPHAVAVDSNDRIFVAEGNSSSSYPRNSVFSEKGEFQTSFKHQDMEYPYGVAIHGDICM